MDPSNHRSETQSLPKKAVVLHSAVNSESRPDDLDTLVQVEAVAAALTSLGYQTLNMEFLHAQDLSMLKASPPDFVFNLVESIDQQDGQAFIPAALLDALGLPYTGASAENLFTTTNKILAKQILSAAKLQTPPWVTLDDFQFLDCLLGKQCILKPISDHASYGISDSSLFVPKTSDEIIVALRQQSELLDSECFLELFIEGREINIASFGTLTNLSILPPAEIKFIDYPEGKPKILSYAAKWEDDSYECINTVRSFSFDKKDSILLSDVRQLVTESWRVFNLNGYARVDVRIDSENQPWILEINVNPCISPDSGMVAALLEHGDSFENFIATVIRFLVDPSRQQSEYHQTICSAVHSFSHSKQRSNLSGFQ